MDSDSSPTAIHPTAIVRGDVTLADGASIGPYCVVEGRVSVGARTQIRSHSVVSGTTQIGADCQVGPHAVVGADPQHLGYKGEPTNLVIGDHVIIREFASVHRASRPGTEHATRIGDHVMIMSTAHVGHDCQVGKHVILASGVLLGGHAIVGERAFLGGNSGVLQFTRVGRLAMIGGVEAIQQDVAPFGLIHRGGHRAYNAVGVRRSGFSRETVAAIRAAYTTLHAASHFRAGAEALAEHSTLVPEVREIVDFIRASKRGLLPSVGLGAEDE